MHFTKQELASLLAGVRALQLIHAHYEGHLVVIEASEIQDLKEIASDFGLVCPLGQSRLDDLAAKLGGCPAEESNG